METEDVLENTEASIDCDSDVVFPEWMFELDDQSLPTYMPVNQLTYTDRTTVRRIYRLASTLAELFERIGLFYWTSGGTTLGIVRHGGLIPWDDDLDVCILQKDERKLTEFSSAFDEEGLCVQRTQPYAWKIFSRHDSVPINNSNYTHRFPFCDVFVMSKQAGRYMLCDKTGRNAWPDEVYTLEQINGVEKRAFGNVLLPCPGRPTDYLTGTYGPGWNKVGKTHFFNHRTGGLLRTETFEIEPDMFLPALPVDYT